MSQSKSSISNSGIPLQEGPKEPGSSRLRGDQQDMSCRRLKRNETEGGVEFFSKQKRCPGAEVEVVFRGERKRGSFYLGEEETERGLGPSKALCCGTRIPEEASTTTTVDQHGAVVEEDLGGKGETSERKAEIHQVVAATFWSKNLGGEAELVTPNPGLQEEDLGGEASLGGRNSTHVQEDDADSDKQENILVEDQTGMTSSSRQEASLAMALLNRFPSIDGEDEEEVEDAVGGGVEEEAGELGERWSRAEASSEPDQVWYRWVLFKYSRIGNHIIDAHKLLDYFAIFPIMEGGSSKFLKSFFFLKDPLHYSTITIITHNFLKFC